MLNRRHIRIKVLQAFYAFSQSNNDDLVSGEKEFMHSMKKIYDLYIYLIQIYIPLKRIANIKIEEAKRSFLKKDKSVFNEAFVTNNIIQSLESSSQLKKIISDLKINWEGVEENELIKKLYKSIYNSSSFQDILNSNSSNFDTQKLHLINLFKQEICNFELMHHFFDEKSIYWQDDLDHVSSMVIKTLKSINVDLKFKVLPLWKEDEKEFALILFRQAILNKSSNDGILQKYSKNWESERLAKMDSLLMNLAITEAKEFSSIPLKVTLNEYIEISKFYSTPKSNGFINGILDKIFEDFKKDGKLKKVGRGLIG
ncbi:transcription antitermination protein NusB [Flavobacteriales bacterium]|jgi:transcription antitermination protein NusB|nr:transcription antitermination protein NusB [Flavobacteriales bacterium]|tara:strand:- start:180 stop:1118 length:939 start_codon:yes stop_codon:yes gene_type:complete